MNEEWKDIPNYEGWYQVSNLGNVRSLDRKIIYSNGKIYIAKGKNLKPTLRKNGYYYVTSAKNSNKPKFDIHKLVAFVFIDNPNNYPCVNHIDGNKYNNRIDNLEWCTYSENAIHADRLGLKLRTYGESNGMSKLTKDDILKIRNLLDEGIKGKDISKMFNIAQSTVSLIKNNKLWSHI